MNVPILLSSHMSLDPFIASSPKKSILRDLTPRDSQLTYALRYTKYDFQRPLYRTMVEPTQPVGLVSKLDPTADVNRIPLPP